MKRKKLGSSIEEIRYEETNPEEGHTKLDNIIKCYPYNPEKVDFKKIPWIRDPGFSSPTPFCGIIENCHRKGFQIFSDLMERLTSPRGFDSREILNLRNYISQYLVKLMEQIDFKKQKEVFIVNNAYKELNSWLEEMYKKICIKDNKSGWKKAYSEESRKLNNIEESYKLYRKNKEKRLKQLIRNYENQREDLLKNIKNEKKLTVSPFKRSSPPLPIGVRPKVRKIPKGMSKLEKINNKLTRYKYSEGEAYQIKNMYRKIHNEFMKIFQMHVFPEDYLYYIISSDEFDARINEILRLIGKDWVSSVNGSLMLIGHSIEELEEKLVFKDLQKYPRVLKNFEKARKNLLDTDWNDVPLYCCKSVERFYNVLLGEKQKYKDLSISDLTEIIRKKEDNLFRRSLGGIKDGLDHLILSTKNLVGTLRNKKDSAHGNPIDVEPWEAKMCYSYTLLLLKTLLNFLK